MADPLNATEIKDDPCAALVPEQVHTLGLQPGVRDTRSFGPVCEYDYAEIVGNRVSVAIPKDLDNGLADVYERKTRLGYFEEARIAGYPAVYAGKYDRRDNGSCQLHVGLTDSFAPTIFVQLTGGTDYGRPCEVAKMTAENMIQNLEG